MKINITTDTKKIITAEELPIARRIVTQEKETDFTAAEAALMACRCTGEHPVEVLKATAEVAKNCRVWNYYTEDSGTLDVWITATVQTWDGFAVLGVYLSDVWSITGDNHAEIAGNMFVRKFAEV